MSCSSLKEFNRDSDFQISEEFFEKTPKSIVNTLNSINEMRNQEFLDAVKAKDYKKVKELLKSRYDNNGRKREKVNIKVSDNIHQTALMWACWNNDFPMVKILCEEPKIKLSSSDYNAVSVNGYTALFCAAYQGNDEIMKYLIKNGATFFEFFNDYNKDWIKKSLEAIKKIPGVIQISDLKPIHDKNNENLLHKMAKSGYANNMKTFLYESDYGIGKNGKKSPYLKIWKKMYYEQDNAGYTPFHYAIARNDSQMVELFIKLEKDMFSNEFKHKYNIFNEVAEKGAYIYNIPAKIGNQKAYPLYTAYKVRNLNIFEMLLNEENLNIKINFPNNDLSNKQDNSSDLITEWMTVFSNENNDISTTYAMQAFKSNYFLDIFELRYKWEIEQNRVGKLDVCLEDYNNNKKDIIYLIKEGRLYSDKQNIKLTFDKVLEKLNEKKLSICGDICGIAYDSTDGKDLLEYAVDSEWSVEEKIELIKWLFENNYTSKDEIDNSILKKCLLNTTKDNTMYLDIAKWIISNKNNYKYIHWFYNSEIYTTFMTNINIRQLLSWEEFKDCLDSIIEINSFYRENPDVNMIYSIFCSKEDKAFYDENNTLYSEQLLKYFFNLNAFPYEINEVPFGIYCLQKKFYYGIDMILSDKKISDTIKLDHSLFKGKSFIDYLNNEKDEHLKPKIEKWIKQYNEIYPSESQQK